MPPTGRYVDRGRKDHEVKDCGDEKTVTDCDLGDGFEAVRGDHVLGGQHDGRGSFRQHESAAVDAEGARGLAGMVERAVGLAQLEAGVHVGEAKHDFRHQRHLHAAHEREVHVAVADHARADGDGVVARRARPLGRKDGAGESQHRPRLARGNIGADIRQQKRADAVGADALIAKEGIAQAVRAAYGRTHQTGGAWRDLGAHGELCVRERVLADRDGFKLVGSIPVVPLLGRVEGVV